MIGTLLANRFEITGLINDGPIFASYAAKDKAASRDVSIRVVKEPFSRHAGFLDSLKAVSQKYSIVRSQHIEGIQEVEQDGAIAFTVTDLTRGPSLADRIKKLAPFSIPVTVSTGISICQALEPIHRYRLPHGDLTPSNIAVLANGDVKLQLTGVWEVYSSSPTAGAMVLPSMSPYLAPEVSQGAMPSQTADVYALGVIMYELLSGRLPYYGENPAAIAQEHANSPVPSVRTINPSVPTVLDEIVKKAMAKDPSDRYQSASELLGDLRLLQDALRFGRSLTWPIRHTEVPAAAAAAKQGDIKSGDVQPVAPRMSAIRSDEEYESSKRKARQERDVPVWMTMTIVFLAAVVLSLVGVWMLMNLNRPQLVPVPNVVGLTSQEARDVLSDSKLQIKVGSRIPSEQVEMDHVLEVNPAAGERVREGSTVTVKLSAGSRYVAVPDLKGLTIDKARTILSSLNLELDPEMVRQADQSVETGLILKSIPASKSKVERNTRIKLVLSAGAGGDSGSGVASESGYLYRLGVRLDNVSEATAVRIEMRDDDGSRTIFDEVRNPGERWEVTAIGSHRKATFDIYYNDQKVKEVPATAKEDQ